MVIFHFSKETGKSIDPFGSHFTLSSILEHQGNVHIAYIHLERDGAVGFHEAAVSQLFIVVDGQGWVFGENKKKVSLEFGTAAFWGKGEGHGAGTDVGMTGIVVESDGLDAGKIMAKVLDQCDGTAKCRT